MGTAADAFGNQVASRYANERLGEALAAAAVAGDRVVPFICECLDIGCVGRVEMSCDDYDDAHVDRSHYVVLRNRLLVEDETVVEAHAGYDAVSKPTP